MTDVMVSFDRGSEVEFDGNRLVVLGVTSDYHIIARDLDSGEQRKVHVSKVRALKSRSYPLDDPDISEPSDDDWAEAKRRRAFIQPFLDKRVTADQAREIAERAGVDARTLRRWAVRFRHRRKLTALLPHRPKGGKGKGRISQEIESLIDSVIQNFYKKPNAPSVKDTIDEVIRQCRYSNVNIPARNTIRDRIKAVDERDALATRGNAKLSRKRFTPKPGRYSEALAPQSVVQIDHTWMDVIAVDQETRQEIGRPIVTLLIDVFSRMVLGCYITMDRPSTLGTGLSIVHAIAMKDDWLRAREIQQEWPCWGLPARLHSDNGRDLRADALRRACEQHNIAHDFRPLLKPEMGGHIERLMGTVAEEIHKLPATTKSSIAKRNEYRSSDHAVLTIPDCEYILGHWITGVYHKRIHSGIGTTPLKRWEEGLFGDGTRPGSGLPTRIDDVEQLLFDFLTAEERVIHDFGVLWDGVRYYDDVLRPYLGIRGKKFIFKRDPRDISKIYFLDPTTRRRLAIPYLNTTLPPMNIWELRAIRQHLAKTAKEAVDEESIFRTYELMRERVASATKQTKSVRRELERKRLHESLPKVKTDNDPSPQSSHGVGGEPTKPPVSKSRSNYSQLVPFDSEEL